MTDRLLRVVGAAVESLRPGIQQIQAEQQVPAAFPAEVETAAENAASHPDLPAVDRTDLPLVTIDPVGAMDLDQAMHLERDGDGYVVYYAIADVGAFVKPEGVIDEEARRRGETLYGGDSRVPLYPTTLSEGSASLLPGMLRPAFVWKLGLDRTGALITTHVERAQVRSTARLDYESVQKQLDDGTASEAMELLREVGRLRVRQEIARGGVELAMPEQEVAVVEGCWELQFRATLPVEDWNAQISLLTGFAAAEMMTRAKIGVLRTLPPPPPEAVARLHRTAQTLGLDFPGEQHYPDFIRGLTATDPKQAAMLVATTTLLRGAAYAAFDGELPSQPEHAALAAEYAHVTAPLRRLVDRFGLEICAALCANESIPDWVRSALPDLPKIMQEADHRGRAYERAILALVESQVLADQVGNRFEGVILELEHGDATKGQLMVRNPAVEAEVAGSALRVGTLVTATLIEADPVVRKVRFAVIE